MVVYRLIGTGTTNSQGVAICNYTGSGKGEVDFVASLDNATDISESSLQSKIYETWDYLCYDKGLDDDYNNTMYNYGNRLTISRDTTGTLLTNTNSSLMGYYIANLGGTSTGSNPDVTEFNSPICIEFEMINTDKSLYGNGIFLADDSSTVHVITLGYYFQNVPCQFRITFDGTYVNVWRDDTQVVTDSEKMTNNPFRLGLSVGANSYLKFKNFKIYSI